MIDSQLQDIILERITNDPGLQAEVSDLVLAATEGPQALEAALLGRPMDVKPSATTKAQPVGAFIESLAVEGFRGIGNRASLTFTPGPGLTLVMGRNGSGKSSFAEALEFLLTGDNWRWSDREKIWREGWRNLHQPAASIEARIVVEGVAGPTTVSRTWAEGALLDDNSVSVQTHGKPKATLDSLGWTDALVTYRPFLSYNELGSMLDEGPSKLYDALSSVLGLTALVDAEKNIRVARLERDRLSKGATARLSGLRIDLEQVDDERAQEALRATAGRRWDIDAIESLVTGTATVDQEGPLQLLRKLQLIETPPPALAQEAAERLDRSRAAVAEQMDTDAAEARRLAGLLAQALDYHESHGDGDCPVCGQGALDADWRSRTETEVERLRERAAVVEQAQRAQQSAIADAHRLLSGPPSFLLKADEVGVDTRNLREAWGRWGEGVSNDDPVELTNHLRTLLAPLEQQAAIVREAAARAADEREDNWRPLAKDLMDWLPSARAAQEGTGQLALLKEAEKWLKAAQAEIRSQRFEPIAEEAQRVWELLRVQSNVDLAKVELVGTGPQRRVKLDVTVDGQDSAALGVMSQGELHSLALSLFLPRATLPESPFRFLVIDDPVQSMDPARVDGLARVLQHVAERRQVIVFTHDDRLPEACRRLQVAATILGVTRRTRSLVEVREELDPVTRYLGDAWALAKTDELPSNVGKRVVPGFCRLAIEAACVEVVRRRRLGRGELHAEVDELFRQATTLTKLTSLAVFDDLGRGGEVMKRINGFGGWAGDAFKIVNKGAHQGFSGDLLKLVRDTESLTDRLKELV